MAIRIRDRSINHILGRKFRYQNGVFISESHDTNSRIYSEHCEDVADSPGLEHNFSVNRFETDGYNGVSGTVPSGFFAGSGYEDWYPPSIYSSNDTHLSMPEDSVTAADWAALAARTNPSRPVVTPLGLIQNVIELPKMLKDAGRLMKKGTKGLNAKDIANQNLAAQFGWMPLIKDIKDLADFQNHVLKRTNEIRRLHQGSGLKRRLKLGSGSAQATVLTPLSTSGSEGRFDAKYERISNFEKYGTIRWKPTSVPTYMDDPGRLNHQVQKIVGGLTPEGLMQGAWDVLPWTWLVDWFSNAGDYLLQNSNTVPAISSNACIMINRITTTDCSKTGSTSAWLTGGDGKLRLEQKQRFVGGSLTPARVPFIGLRRLSILGSLFIQRFKK